MEVTTSTVTVQQMEQLVQQESQHRSKWVGTRPAFLSGSPTTRISLDPTELEGTTGTSPHQGSPPGVLRLLPTCTGVRCRPRKTTTRPATGRDVLLPPSEVGEFKQWTRCRRKPTSGLTSTVLQQLRTNGLGHPTRVKAVVRPSPLTTSRSRCCQRHNKCDEAHPSTTCRAEALDKAKRRIKYIDAEVKLVPNKGRSKTSTQTAAPQEASKA